MAVGKLFSNCFEISRNILKRTIKMVHILAPPNNVKGMTVLDREAFTSTVEVPALNLGSVPSHKVMPPLKKYLLKLKKRKAIQTIDKNLIAYLDPQKVDKFDDIDEDDRKIISEFCQKLERISITIKYENWSPEQIFRAVLPQEVEMPASFTNVGHILHLNLRDNQLPFKKLIGEVYLDSIPQTKTVVNKLNNIETEFRHFPMEILAGDGDTVTTVKESNCSFTFDFAKVYWNSRLSTEHANLLLYMNKGDVLYDVFAGVGPFAVPAARKGVVVLANDLNPESYKWLQFNAAANKAKALNSFNKDGREFLRNEVKTHILARRSNDDLGVEHLAMNLPAIAYEFLDVFRDWVDENEAKIICRSPVLIHLYCFVRVAKNEDPKPVAQSLVESSIDTELSPELIKIIHRVRNVAPNKDMMRVSFYLTEKMLKKEEPVKKKRKLENSDDPSSIFIENSTVTGQNGEEQRIENKERI